MNQLKISRIKCGLSAKAVAAELDVTQQTISYWENGHRQPSMENYIKLANIYGVSVDYLTGKNANTTLNDSNEKKEPAVIGELDEDFVQELIDLTPDEVQFVRGVVAGIRARRVIPSSQTP